MGALFDQASLVKDENLIGGQDGRESVGDHHRRSSNHQALESILNQRLRTRIERGSGFVEYENRRVFEEHPCDGEPLALTPREAVTTFTDHRRELLGQGFDELRDVGCPCSVPELGIGGIGTGITKIGANCVVEEVGLLGYDTDARAPTPRRSMTSRRHRRS